MEHHHGRDGGELRLIQNRDLRQALAGWQARVGEAAFTNQAMYDAIQLIWPVLYEMDEGSARSPKEQATLRTFEESSTYSLEQQRELRNDLAGIQTLLEAELAR